MSRKLSFSAAVLALSLLAGCSGTAAVTSSAPPEHSVSAPATPEPTPEPVPTPTPLPWPVYQFGAPLEESEPVADDSFFDDAVFLGDSRTEGLHLFGGLKHGTYYHANGMNVFRVDNEDYKIAEVDGQKYTLIGALGKRSYRSVYIMIGVNELGYPAESYEQGLAEFVDKVLAAQPDAVVYLQLMPPLNDAMCRANKLPDYITNANLKQFNDAIVRVAAEKRVVLLNTAEAYTGADGQLPAELASDGCHFAYGEYGRWADYLRTHVIDRERYFYSRDHA